MRYQEILEACWQGYRQAGMKKKGDRQVPNCVPVEEGEVVSLKDDPKTIRRLAAQWWNGNEQQYSQAQQMLNRMGWDIFEDEDNIVLAKNGQEYTIPMDELESEAIEEDLRKWFKEKWVRFGPDGKIRGSCARGSESEGKPKCLPQSKAHALGKKGRASAAAKKRREDPNPERRGKARNVATKTDEAMTDYQKRRQRERDVDMGRPVKPLPKNPKTDYQKRREQQRRDMEMGEAQLDEKQDACYRKVKSRYKVWPSAYASGALVQCRKKGAANWGTGAKKK